MEIDNSNDKVHAIILTLNESRHIARCIGSCKDHVDTITVVDSGSVDDTVKIAQELGASVIYNPWINYASQLNFGISFLSDRGGWLMRIDADEVVDPKINSRLTEIVSRVEGECNGILVQRRIYFLGRRIKRGAIEPSWQLRLWRNGSGRCEQRWMDEQVVVTGSVQKSTVVFSDINLNTMTWWTEKHNQYASREAIDVLNSRRGFLKQKTLPVVGASPQARLRRLAKEEIYLRTPAGVRAIAYFLYRYVLRFGFLDGVPGFYFHLLQGLWYRSLVDAKVLEIEKLMKEKDMSVESAIKACTGIVVD